MLCLSQCDLGVPVRVCQLPATDDDFLVLCCTAETLRNCGLHTLENGCDARLAYWKRTLPRRRMLSCWGSVPYCSDEICVVSMLVLAYSLSVKHNHPGTDPVEYVSLVEFYIANSSAVPVDACFALLFAAISILTWHRNLQYAFESEECGCPNIFSAPFR